MPLRSVDRPHQKPPLTGRRAVRAIVESYAGLFMASLLLQDVSGKYIENENLRTASFREHRAAACCTNANASFECPLSPIRITGEASG